MIKVGINGFGRIGRCLLKIIEEQGCFEVVAINDIDPDLKNMLYLLRYDSTYGKYGENINQVDEGTFTLNGKSVAYSAEEKIEDVDWKGAELIFCASGTKSNVEGAGRMIRDGRVKHAVVTHASGIADKTIVMGVNDGEFDAAKHKLISSSICDANAVAQVVKHVDAQWGLKNCFFTTLHPWLSYQNLLDGTLKSVSSPGHFWKDYALGRGAAESMIPKPTTASDAVVAVLPEMNGRLDAISFRTPTAIVSSSDMTITCSREVSADEVKAYFKDLSVCCPYIHYNEESLVSLDYRQTEYSAIIDGQWIRVLDGNMLKIVVWYDNEWGYSARAVDVARLLSNSK